MLRCPTNFLDSEDRVSAPITQIIIFINIAAYILESVQGDILIAQFALWPLGPNFHAWQIVSYAFLHGSLTHILFNMFGLNMFGSDVERHIGSSRFVIFYFVCVVAAAVTQLAVSSAMGTNYPTIGASGGIFGVLLAFAIFFPERKIIPLIPPIPMPARVFVVVYGGVELLLGVTGSQAGVAHFAHLGGMLGAILALLFWRLSHDDSSRM